MIDSNLDKMKDNIKHKQTMKSLNDRLDALKNSGGNKTKRRKNKKRKTRKFRCRA
jgi:hypothetical protein